MIRGRYGSDRHGAVYPSICVQDGGAFVYNLWKLERTNEYSRATIRSRRLLDLAVLPTH
jgi:hypothetical protein